MTIQELFIDGPGEQGEPDPADCFTFVMRPRNNYCGDGHYGDAAPSSDQVYSSSAHSASSSVSILDEWHPMAELTNSHTVLAPAEEPSSFTPDDTTNSPDTTSPTESVKARWTTSLLAAWNPPPNDKGDEKRMLRRMTNLRQEYRSRRIVRRHAYFSREFI
jgi:hypothetical protein